MGSSLVTIAIAEDHNLVRKGFIHVIHECTHYKVIAEAENGLELINKITALTVPPDVCIVDICMPVLNGFDTAHSLKANYPKMKILALTQFDEEYSIISMIQNGANGYLLKGCTTNELHEAISSVHANGYYYSQTASEKAFAVVQNNHLPELTPKELEFLCLCPSDLRDDEIAEIMNISVHTVHEYQKHVCKKLHIHSRKDLALFAVYSGLVSVHKMPKKTTAKKVQKA